MALEMFIKLEGITGESKDYDHKGWSVISSWAWGMSNNETTGDKPVFKELTFTKRLGIDSTYMMLHFAQAKRIKNVELSITPVMAKREAKQKYLSMKMEDVLIKSITTGGSASDDRFDENILLSFSKVRFEYSFNTQATHDTAASSVDHNFGWDSENNQEWQPVTENA